MKTCIYLLFHKFLYCRLNCLEECPALTELGRGESSGEHCIVWHWVLMILLSYTKMYNKSSWLHIPNLVLVISHCTSHPKIYIFIYKKVLFNWLKIKAPSYQFLQNNKRKWGVGKRLKNMAIFPHMPLRDHKGVMWQRVHLGLWGTVQPMGQNLPLCKIEFCCTCWSRNQIWAESCAIHLLQTQNIIYL